MDRSFGAAFIAMAGLVALGGSPPVKPTAVLFSSNRSGIDAIYLTNTEGAPTSRVVAGTQPAWCGAKLAFVRSGDLFVAHLDGTAEEQLTQTAAVEAHPTCSPDGTQIAFSRSSANGGADIYSLTLRDHREHRMTFDGADTQPAWSPSGRLIVFVAAGHLAVMNIDGSGLRKWAGGDGNDADPAWLGDDSKILFDRTSGGESHLWYTGIGFGPGLPLTHAPGDQRNPSFASLKSPLPVIFQAREGANDYHIYAMSFDGSSVKELTTGPGADTDPVVQPADQTHGCECSSIGISLTASATPAARQQRRVRVVVHWALRCSPGYAITGECQGRVVLSLPKGQLRFAGASRRTRVTISCNSSACGSITTGTAVEPIGYRRVPLRATLLVRRECKRGTRYLSVGKVTTYELRVDARARPSLRRRRG
jgi:TolB protein